MRKRKGIFTPEQDRIIYRVYPSEGSRGCIKAIQEELKFLYDGEQIRGRAKRLGVCREENFARVMPEIHPGRQYWRHYPITMGACKITGYYGYYQTGRKGRSSHIYETECVNCGRKGRRQQVSIREAYLKETKGCVHCANLIRKETMAKEKNTDHAKHIALMASMRVSSAPLTLSPEFDFYA